MLLNPREYTKSRLNPEWADRLLVDEFESISPTEFLSYLLARGIPANEKDAAYKLNRQKTKIYKIAGIPGGGKNGGEMVERVAEAIRCYFSPRGNKKRNRQRFRYLFRIIQTAAGSPN